MWLKVTLMIFNKLRYLFNNYELEWFDNINMCLFNVQMVPVRAFEDVCDVTMSQ